MKLSVQRPNTHIAMLGQTYGHLTVTDFVLERGHWWARVECACGNKGLALPRQLNQSKRVTCGLVGCPHFHAYRQKHGKMAGFTGHGEIFGCRWAAWRIGAEKRGIPFLVSIAEAWSLFLRQNRRCALTGIELHFGTSWDRSFTASLDRIDSTKPYTDDNVQWVHKRINLMKSDLSEEDLRFWCRAVHGFASGSEVPSAEEVAKHERPVRGASNWKKGNRRRADQPPDRPSETDVDGGITPE